MHRRRRPPRGRRPRPGRPCRRHPWDDVAGHCFACRVSGRGCAGTSRAGCDTSLRSGRRGWLGSVRRRNRVRVRRRKGMGALDRRARCDFRRRGHPFGAEAYRVEPVGPVSTRTGACGRGDRGLVGEVPRCASQPARAARPPDQGPVDHSKGAELLVVGSRGRSGFAGMLLGSVSQGVLHHAHCPVAVVRPSKGLAPRMHRSRFQRRSSDSLNPGRLTTRAVVVPRDPSRRSSRPSRSPGPGHTQYSHSLLSWPFTVAT